jgi:hypothetical protein
MLSINLYDLKVCLGSGRRPSGTPNFWSLGDAELSRRHLRKKPDNLWLVYKGSGAQKQT